MAEPGDPALVAATRSGFRQALEQVAAQLRTQATAWRAEAQAELGRASKKRDRKRAEARIAEVERWCASLEQIAAMWAQKAQQEQLEEQRAKAEAARAMRGTMAREPGILERLFRRR